MDSSNPNGKPKRRIRYKGTHPRRFEEKYKEHKPQSYVDDAKKIMGRGATLAGTHRPICLKEIFEILQPKPGDVVLDATLGYGGHSEVFLQKLSPGGTLISLDQDPIEREKTEARLKKSKPEDVTFIVGGINFRDVEKFLAQSEIKSVDLVLADLGLSSMQIDNPKRGFSFKSDSVFDLRMNPNVGRPAHEFLASLSLKELEEILVRNADEPHARQIAAALKSVKIKTTTEAAQAIRSAVDKFPPKVKAKEGDTPIRRAFQALRIEVNDEYSALDEFLISLPKILRPGGKAAILSFHSGEDRRVKKSFQFGFRSGLYKEIANDAIRPSMEEQHSNPRSKPAKLRWILRT